MLKKSSLLAQMEDTVESIKATAAAQKTGPLISSDLMMILAVIIGIAVLLFLFVYLLRRRTVDADDVLYRTRETEPHLSNERSGKAGRRRRRRADHPSRLRRNPTLAETGGLPPPRKEEPDIPPDSTPPPAQNQKHPS